MTDEAQKDNPAPPEDISGRAKTVDEGWKAEAKREKEKLDHELENKPDSKPEVKPEAKLNEELDQESQDDPGHRTPQELPPASFLLFVSGIAAQALMQLGEIENPIHGKHVVDLDAARYSIDIIGILEEKTQGNLNDEEARYVGAALHDLRMRYVAVASGKRPATEGEATEGEATE